MLLRCCYYYMLIVICIFFMGMKFRALKFVRIFSRLKFPTDHHTVPCQCVTITTTHHMLSRTHWRPHATSSPGRFSLALEMGPPLKPGKSALGTRLEAARNLVPRAPVRGLKRPGDEVGKHGPHQSKYTKTGRPRIQRYVRQLIWALDVNDFGQTKKVNSPGYIYFLTLTSLFAHQSGQSFYSARML